MPNDTRTKILATLGPSSNTEEKISALIEAGIDGFRLNFSHGTQEEHKRTYEIVRRVAKEKGVRVTVVADMQGPKLRIGTFKDGEVLLKKGQKFTLDMQDIPGDETRVLLPHKEIFEALKAGDKLLVNDGNIVLNVLKCNKESAETEVEVGGVISGHKGVNLPNSSLNISPLTEKDHSDLQFALGLGVDCICLSFVQRASDIKEARKIIGKRAWIISKLEKPQVLDDLDNIIKASDMVMVARGDLGVECPIVTVPVLQKRIVSRCRVFGKPVIVATQMLESMMSAPMPTRAEVSDIANAVYDGCDVVIRLRRSKRCTASFCRWRPTRNIWRACTALSRGRAAAAKRARLRMRRAKLSKRWKKLPAPRRFRSAGRRRWQWRRNVRDCRLFPSIRRRKLLTG